MIISLYDKVCPKLLKDILVDWEPFGVGAFYISL